MAITKVTEGVRTLGTEEVLTANIKDGDVTTAKMATDPTNASNLSSGSVPTAQLGNVDTSGITANQDDIALLGFKVAANGSLARYNLVDQSIDAFEDASGVDASASTNAVRDSDNYYSGNEGGSLLTTLTSGTSYTTPAGVTSLNILLVAGGGGGSGIGGGGGGGGIVHHPSFAVSESTAYTYAIGSGGSATAYNSESSGAGGDTTFSTLTAKGGGGASGNASPGMTGGSGGGGNGGHGSPGGSSNQTSQPGDSGTYGYGNAGGDGTGVGGYAGGGGGGSNAAGTDAPGVGFAGGVGGAGKLFSDFTGSGTNSSNETTGTRGYYGGGGGGANNGAAGVGGGGAGGGSGTAGTASTGGGGGGAQESQGNGQAGGTGIIVIRESDTFANMTLISNAQTAQSAPTNGDLVITYTDAAGTATINTDLKAYISRDGSAYTSAVTLASQGTTGGHTVLTANGVDLSGITSGTSMRWKIETLNQSASKITRIQAVSLGWS